MKLLHKSFLVPEWWHDKEKFKTIKPNVWHDVSETFETIDYTLKSKKSEVTPKGIGFKIEYVILFEKKDILRYTSEDEYLIIDKNATIKEIEDFIKECYNKSKSEYDSRKSKLGLLRSFPSMSRQYLDDHCQSIIAFLSE